MNYEFLASICLLAFFALTIIAAAMINPVFGIIIAAMWAFMVGAAASECAKGGSRDGDDGEEEEEKEDDK